MAVNVAVGLVYYLRVVALLLRPAEHATPVGTVGRPVQVVLAATLAAAVILSVLPGPLFTAVYS